MELFILWVGWLLAWLIDLFVS